MIYKEAFEKGKEILTAAGVEEAVLDARLLLEFVCETDRNTLLVHGDREVSGTEEEKYFEVIQKRAEHIPLQQLTNVQNFMGLDFYVNEHVLIPRQDTEVLVEEVLRNLHDGMHILDMCTGSGCILNSLIKYSNVCTGVGADISDKALEVAKRNTLAIFGDVDYISYVQSDLFENITDMFDMIVSNPPYIQSAVVDSLMPEVREHEPRIALDGSEDGLLFYNRIVKEGKKCLKKGGMLFFEIGYDQGEAVKNLMEKNGYLEVTVVQDYAGLDRVVFGTLSFEG